MKKLALVVVLLSSLPSLAQIPAPVGYVNDFANVINNAPALEQTLKDIDARQGNQIAVVTVTSLNGSSVETVAQELFDSWKIGNAKTDSGVLFLVAVSDRKMRIQTGYGVESALPDAVCARILDGVKPYFKAGDYTGGIFAGVDQIAKHLVPQVEVATQQNSSSFPVWPWVLIVVCISILGLLLVGGAVALPLWLRDKREEEEREKKRQEAMRDVWAAELIAPSFYSRPIDNRPLTTVYSPPPLDTTKRKEHYTPRRVEEEDNLPSPSFSIGLPDSYSSPSSYDSSPSFDFGGGDSGGGGASDSW